MVQVLNRFESPEDATNRDNPLVLDGTVEGTAIDAIQGRQITTYLADVSTAASAFALPGFAGTVVKVTTIRGGTIDSGSSTVQPRIEGIAIPGTTINFGAAGPGGETANSPTTGNVFSATDTLEVSTTGGSVGTSPLFILFYVLPDEV